MSLLFRDEREDPRPDPGDLVEAAVASFEERLHPRGRTGEWVRKLGFQVTMRDKPDQFEQHARVVLPDGREGTVSSLSHARGGEQHYIVVAPKPKRGTRAYNEAQVHHEGKWVKRKTAVASVRKQAEARFKGLDTGPEQVKRAVDEYLGGWEHRDEGSGTEEVPHSKLAWHPEELASAREQVGERTARAEAGKYGAKKALPVTQRPVTLTPHLVPDDWKVEHGYASWAKFARGGRPFGHAIPGTPGEEGVSAHMKSGVNTEEMIYHWLSGKKAETKYPKGTRGYEQWSYTGSGGKKADRDALLRKITQAGRARADGDEAGHDRLILEAVLIRLRLGGELVEASRFEERLHPRGVHGRFIEVLTHVRLNGAHNLSQDVSVEKSMVGYRVKHPGGVSHHMTDEGAVHAAISHVNDAVRQDNPKYFMASFTPGGEQATATAQAEPRPIWKGSKRTPRPRVSKAQAMVDSGLADDLADARAQLLDMGETGGLLRWSPGDERAGDPRRLSKLAKMRPGTSQRFGALQVVRSEGGFQLTADGVTRTAPSAEVASRLISAHFQGRGLTLEHPERVAAKERLRRAGEADPSRLGREVNDAVGGVYAALGAYPLSREEALASGLHTPGGERPPFVR